MVQQAYGQRFWGFPGGVVDEGETPVEAAIRECFEETGLVVELTEVIGLYLLQGGGWPVIQAYVFAAQIAAGEPHIVNPREIACVEWRSPTDIPSPLVPDAEAALHDLRLGQTGQVRTVRRQVSMPPITE